MIGQQQHASRADIMKSKSSSINYTISHFLSPAAVAFRSVRVPPVKSLKIDTCPWPLDSTKIFRIMDGPGNGCLVFGYRWRPLRAHVITGNKVFWLICSKLYFSKLLSITFITCTGLYRSVYGKFVCFKLRSVPVCFKWGSCRSVSGFVIFEVFWSFFFRGPKHFFLLSFHSESDKVSLYEQR